MGVWKKNTQYVLREAMESNQECKITFYSYSYTQKKKKHHMVSFINVFFLVSYIFMVIMTIKRTSFHQCVFLVKEITKQNMTINDIFFLRKILQAWNSDLLTFRYQSADIAYVKYSTSQDNQP